ncbi:MULTISPECIES: CgeB family protein [Actibacterium]|uniref:Spore maturation protein CgeB n=1 Tax=Actibacterium naphthalenivorans TaxID=1614693 RepID=A0A840C5T0_9RHOB|nr:MULTISPECIES: glycosyltransferase [Actibacterium]ALG89211.1 glycosyltransferase [Actibacterium sp. EMB200-NS6]MBB4021204.1 spore maturation protein CgeB [Actibacterium naphthalenivorans]
MKFTFFTHSLVSDWNHGNAHFLRGVMRALQAAGHECLALEPADGWSRSNLIADRGEAALRAFHATFPDLRSESYGGLDEVAEVLEKSDVVVVHEWTDPQVVADLGRMRARGAPFRLLFHDTHHRAVSAGEELRTLDLSAYDGVLAFGETLRQRYLAEGWGSRVFTWHEAADDTVFRPLPEIAPERDLIWVGNWGDGERSAELHELLVRPVAELNLSATVHGVRYPEDARRALSAAGIDYAGSIANADVPEAFARHRVTVHIPRRPYVEALSGIPTIRPFEAMACGIPLVCAPWEDSEGLFRPGTDYLIAANGEDMKCRLRDILADRALAQNLAACGLETIRARHTCRHRAAELLAILDTIGTRTRETA